MKVAFIGLGQMGIGMARNLAKAGHQLLVYNRTQSKAEELRDAGATVARTPAEAGAGADVAITMLADDKAVEQVVFGQDGLAEGLKPGALHASMSTISVALSRRLAGAHREKKQSYIAAPVFGRPDAAAAAKLFVVVAGAKADLERCQPVFDALGQKTFVVGEDASQANVVKLTGNFLITTVIESMAESFALMEKSGIKREVFLDVMTNSLFNAPIYRNYGGIIAQNKYEPVGFKMPLGLKDNRLILAHAEECAVPLPMASLVRDRFLAAMAQGLQEADWSAIARIAMREAGIEKS